ncbi:MAG: hypothetical protein QXO95_04665, partial [Candidatus Aenigmatarchaeota archaeon]
ISEEKLTKALLMAKMEAYSKATEKGKENLRLLEKLGKSLFRIKEIYKTIKSEEVLEDEKIWFLANVSSFSLPLIEREWLKEVYVVKNSKPFNIYARCSCKASLDFLSNELFKLFGLPLERELVIVFSTFKKY